MHNIKIVSYKLATPTKGLTPPQYTHSQTTSTSSTYKLLEELSLPKQPK
jgi:hypothetical protein